MTEHEGDQREFFRERGFGLRLGFGERPAVLVIDFMNAFTDRDMPLGADLDAEVEATVELLKAARAAELPIFYTVAWYDEEGMADAGIWVRKHSGSLTLKSGTHAVELDPRLARRDNEGVILKKYASSFFGTDLISRLNARRVDTLILAGCTTSGCVRATAVDALQLGVIPVIVAEAVGDRSKSAHEQSLFDLEQKYADVVSLQQVIDHLRSPS